MALPNRNNFLPRRHTGSSKFISLLVLLTCHWLVAPHRCHHENANSNENSDSDEKLWWYELSQHNPNGSNHAASSQMIFSRGIRAINQDPISMVAPPPEMAAENFGPTDDELMTQASKLNSHMTRILPPIRPQGRLKLAPYEPSLPVSDNLYNSADPMVQTNVVRTTTGIPLPPVTTFDDTVSSSELFRSQPEASIQAESAHRSFFTNQPPAGFGTNGNFPIQNDLNNYSDRIWSYFDSASNRPPNQRPQSWRTFGSQEMNSGENSGGGGLDHSLLDSYISKLEAKVQKREKSNAKSASLKQKKSKKSSSTGTAGATSKKDSENKNVLSLNLGRRKNQDEKDKFRLLMQNIFDNTPRKYATEYNYAGNQYGSGSIEEDVLKDHQEENVDLTGTSAEDEDQTSGEDERSERSAMVEQNKVSEESSEEEPEITENLSIENEDDFSEREEDPIGGSLRRGVSSSSESEEEEPEESPIENNKFFTMRNRTKNAEFRNLTTSSPRKRAPFRNLSIGNNRPKNSVLIMATTTANPLDDIPTTFVPPTVPPNELVESLSLTADITGQQFAELVTNGTKEAAAAAAASAETETEEPEDLTSMLITNRKPQSLGKWMDAETFELRNDDDSDSETKPRVHTRRNHAVQIDFQPIVMKSPGRRSKSAAIIASSSSTSPAPGRFARQNMLNFRTHSGSNDDDDLARLTRTLNGIPGQDYPVFGAIPRTTFNCRDHKWPGYYADVEAQCQVFHICQLGGRKTSFLCPNGTMFNQQLFVCDWWHNVQCDQQETMAQYELNAAIYDPQNWESNRIQSSQQQQPKSTGSRTGGGGNLRLSIRRMAVLDENSSKNSGDIKEDSDLDSDFPSTTPMPSITTTTTIPTTTENNNFFTESSVFGPRMKPDVDDGNGESNQSKPKRKVDPGTKGGNWNGADPSRFSQMIQQNKLQTKQAMRFVRHKFAHQGQLTKSTPIPQLLMAAANHQIDQVLTSNRLQATPASAIRGSTRPGRYYRT